MDTTSAMCENNNNDENLESMQNTFDKYLTYIFIDKKMTMAQYIELHDHVYDFCIKGKDPTIWIGTTNRTGTFKIRKCIEHFLNEHINEIAQNTPEMDMKCLEYYYKEWEDFRRSCCLLNGACQYYNKNKSTRSGDRKSVEQVVLTIWCENMFKHFNKRISNAVLQMLDRNREGECINANVIETVVRSYIELGSLDLKNELDQEASADNHLTIYKDFERQVVNGTHEYMNKNGEIAMEKLYIEQKSFVAYMKHVHSVLKDEFKRAKLFHTTTTPAMMNLCYDVLITKHLDAFDSEFRIFLNADKIDEMELMCSLAVHSEPVIKQLNAIFESYVLKQGLEEIEKCANEAIKDPKTYIEAILIVYNKYNDLVIKRFANEPGFAKALDKACAKFINANEVTKKCKSTTKTAESLALYCHSLLKISKQNMENIDVETTLNDIMIVFRFLQDKDVFEDYYRHRLAERLIGELSASDDAEALMISKMKQACGYDYTNKLQNMYQDIEISKNLNNQFRETPMSADGTHDLGFRIKVLTHGSWPFRQGLSCNVPVELTRSIDRFTGFYNKKHSGRKLIWMYKLSKAELAMNGRYVIKANIFQTALLLQFNEQTTFTVKQIHENTGIDLKYLIPLLKSTLIKKKILKQLDENDLTETSTITFNTGYNGSKLRFDITARVEPEPERQQHNERIDENRSFMIDAAVIRVMKMRKTLKYQSLLSEVMSQLSSKFKPKVVQIKKSIEKLIEREYLERHPSEKDSYNYLA